MTSQHRQDHYVLAVLGRKRSGYFLDSGASNGTRCSNTELLEKRYGWTGICVEPDPQFFQELVKNRNCTCINGCLYDTDGTAPFVHAGTISGVPEHYSPELLPHVRAALGLADEAPLPVDEMTCLTPATLLEQCRAPRVIDYWSLDTEGSELTILRNFPFDEYVVRVLTVEHNWGADRAAIHALLGQHGFKWVAELVCDDVFVHRSLGPPRSRTLRRVGAYRLAG